MNKKFIHKPKIKIIYSEFRSSQKPKIKIKNSTLLFPRMSVPRSRSFLFFYKNKIRSKRVFEKTFLVELPRTALGSKR